MSMESAPEDAVPPRADLVSALVWILFGGGVTAGAWRMDRLENLHINQYEIPGLVPGLLGAAILLLGIALAVRALKQGALGPAGAAAPRAPGARLYTALVLGAMFAYSVVFVGRGLPFWLVTLLFVAAFIFFFDRERQSALGRGTARQALLALVYGGATSAVVTLVFQEIFYVRLP
jgi:hypothetical protein